MKKSQIAIWAIILTPVLSFVAWTTTCNFLTMRLADDLMTLETRVDDLPPKEWQQRIESVEKNVDDLEQENRNSHTRIEATQNVMAAQVSAMDAKLGMLIDYTKAKDGT